MSANTPADPTVEPPYSEPSVTYSVVRAYHCQAMELVMLSRLFLAAQHDVLSKE